jgi:hypothetical protein
MTKGNKIIIYLLASVSCLVSPLTICVHGQNRMAGNDSLSFEVLLTDRMFSDFKPAGSLIPSLDITTERFILLSLPDQYYVLGWGGIVPLGTRMNREIQSFAYTPDGLLMTVSGNDLCSFDSSGNLTSIVRLPRTGMGISAGTDVMYLFDRNPGQKPYPLYVFARKGKYLKLIDSPDPITSVAETGDAVLFAAGSKLYGINPGTKEVKLLFAEENDRKIISVTADEGNNIAYFSTADMIFAIRDQNLATVSEKSGGILKYFNGLIVLNPETKLVIRILGLEEELKVKQSGTDVVTFKGSQTAQVPQTSESVPAAQTGKVARGTQVTQAGQATQNNQAAVAVNTASADQAAREPGPTPDIMESETVIPAMTGAGTETRDIGTIKVLTNEAVVALVQNELGDNIIINLIRRTKVDFSLTTDDVINLSGKGVSPAVIMEMRQAMIRQASEIQNR